MSGRLGQTPDLRSQAPDLSRQAPDRLCQASDPGCQASGLGGQAPAAFGQASAQNGQAPAGSSQTPDLLSQAPAEFCQASGALGQAFDPEEVRRLAGRGQTKCTKVMRRLSKGHAKTAELHPLQSGGDLRASRWVRSTGKSRSVSLQRCLEIAVPLGSPLRRGPVVASRCARDLSLLAGRRRLRGARWLRRGRHASSRGAWW